MAIAAALAGRAAQRGFVVELEQSWKQLVASFTALVELAEKAGRAAARPGGTGGDHGRVAAELAGYLNGDPDGWLATAIGLSQQLDQATDKVTAIHRRVHRETVNIGVIGMTKAGKSTLLQRLTGLGEEQVPSSRFRSTTAAPSRIVHEPGAGRGRAVVDLHSWESFRGAFLVPLHARAGLGPPARTLDEFRRQRYVEPSPGGVPADQVGPERYLRRLRQAHASLWSYENDLRGGHQEITLDKLRPYVAYPSEDDPRPAFRPYHAVRAVRIYCEFPNVGAVGLSLVDLPGAGEAGLDVHRQFLSSLRNEVDLLFVVKRPDKANAQVNDPDWDVIQLAGEAATGVRMPDFVRYLINRDREVPPDYLDHGAADARREGERLGFAVQECDIKYAENAAQEILAPTLAHLAARLADMDQDAVKYTLDGIRDLAHQVRGHVRELTRHIENWQAGLPKEERLLRDRVVKLRREISVALGAVLARYDGLDRAGEPIEALRAEIDRAVGEIERWQRDGYGAGSTAEWTRDFYEAMSARETGTQLDHEYNMVRLKVSEVFGEIDASLARSVDLLWGEVAAVLRAKLTDKIVPAMEPRAALTQFAALARQHRLKTLYDATTRLLELPTDYGSIFLRVGRPIVRKIDWERAGPPPGNHALTIGSAVIGGMVGGPVGHVVGGLVGDAVGGAVSAGVRETIRSAATGGRPWWQQGPTEPEPAQPEQPAGPGQPADSAGQADPKAQRRHAELTQVIHAAVHELQAELHAEARRTVKVLAAAADQFKESVISTPGVDHDFVDLCRPVQRDIWPDSFADADARLVADMATVLEHAITATAAADSIAGLAAQAHKL
ncbi:MAG TPA: hypothetical protein VLJ59_14570 [Mycobacteriales bacterium]|nr:hypothetical protein [Mycobacteriales bacterium]